MSIEILVDIFSQITQSRRRRENDLTINPNLLIQNTTLNNITNNITNNSNILTDLDNIVHSYTETLNERDANILNNVHASFNNIINSNSDTYNNNHSNNVINSYNDNSNDNGNDNDNYERLLSFVTINNTLFNSNNYNYSDDSEDEDNDGTIYFNNLEDVPIVLTNVEFNIFPKKTVTNRYISLLNTSKCTICLDNYVLKEKYTTLLCNHNFHEKCIKKWLCEKSIHCPICRMSQKKTCLKK